LREKRGLRVFENRALRTIFRPKRDEVAGEWRKLHNEELTDLYSTKYCSGDKIENNAMGGHVAFMGERRGVYRFLVGKPDGKRRLGRLGRRWEDNLKMELQEVGCGGHGVDPAGSGQGQVADTCECGNEISGFIKCGEFLD